MVEVAGADLRRREDELSEKERRREALEARRDKRVNVLTLFNRVGIQTELLGERGLSAEEIELLRGHVETVVTRNEAWAKLNGQ